MASTSACERVLRIPELFLHILDFIRPKSVGYSDERVFNLISEFRDFWVHCRSVSRHWKNIIENEPRFQKYSWRQTEISNGQDSKLCYPAICWFNEAFRKIVHKGSSQSPEDYKRLSDIAQQSFLRDLSIAEPAVTDVFVAFRHVSLEKDHLLANYTFVVSKIARYGRRTGFIMSNANGIKVGEVLNLIIHVLARSPGGIEPDTASHYLEIAIVGKNDKMDAVIIDDDFKKKPTPNADYCQFQGDRADFRCGWKYFRLA